MGRGFLRSVLLFALLHYLALLVTAGVIFLLSHVPPKTFNLDGAILVLFQWENLLTAPRKLFLRLWPGELTPGWLSFVTTVLNSLLWGAGLAALRMLWRKLAV
jgi:hypothetical protein